MKAEVKLGFRESFRTRPFRTLLGKRQWNPIEVTSGSSATIQLNIRERVTLEERSGVELAAYEEHIVYDSRRPRWITSVVVEGAEKISAPDLPWSKKIRVLPQS